MEKNDKFLVVFYVLLGVGVIFGLYSIDSSLEKPIGPLNLAPIPLSNISITKVIDIKTENFYTILSDVENYPRVLPKNVLSVNKIEETNSLLVYEITIVEKGIKSTLLIKQDFFPYEKQILTVVDGDAKNTIITQKFQNQGNSTKLITDIEIELSGVLTAFGFLPQSNVNHAMNTILTSFVEYSIEKTQNEKIVDDLYRDILKRPADQEGLSHFTSLLEQNKIIPEEIKMKLYNSEEYHSTFLSSDLKNIDELSNETKNTINELYEIILRRIADPKGLQYFGSYLENGKMTLSEIRNAILISDEFNSLPVETRELNKTYMSNESWQIVNQTYYEIHDKYPDKKIVRAYGIFFEKGTLTLNDIKELFKKIN